MVELVDAPDSKSGSERSVGSIPTARTNSGALGCSDATACTSAGAAGVAQATTDDTASPGRKRVAAILHTPDARYIVVRVRLWRASNPHLDTQERQRLVEALMHARRAVHNARTDMERAAARAAVDAAKRGLGERGPLWWDDGEPDLNRRMAVNTPYASWYKNLSDANRKGFTTAASRVIGVI